MKSTINLTAFTSLSQSIAIDTNYDYWCKSHANSIQNIGITRKSCIRTNGIEWKNKKAATSISKKERANGGLLHLGSELQGHAGFASALFIISSYNIACNEFFIKITQTAQIATWLEELRRGAWMEGSEQLAIPFHTSPNLTIPFLQEAWCEAHTSFSEVACPHLVSSHSTPVTSE
jgi:hypothetical protein